MADQFITELNGGVATTTIKRTDLLVVETSPTGTPLTKAMTAGSHHNGWIEVPETWTYTSASTITVPTDATTIYQKWMRVRFKQGGGYKYYVVRVVAATLLTVVVTTDYTVANAAITDVAYSFLEKPFGFPDEFNTTITFTNLTIGNGTLASKLKVSALGRIDHHWELDWGSTTSISGSVSYALPVPQGTYMASTVTPIGMCRLTDGGAGAFFFGLVEALTNVGYMTVSNIAGTYPSNTPVNATVPMTWASDDVMTAQTSYFG